MKLTEIEVNTGIIIKALFENVQKGKASYTIHPMWQEIIDHKRLIVYQSAELLEYNENILNLTSKGLEELKSLFNSNEKIPITELVQKLYQDAENIVIHFDQLIEPNHDAINESMKKKGFLKK